MTEQTACQCPYYYGLISKRDWIHFADAKEVAKMALTLQENSYQYPLP
jgi:hypothetical protein